MKISESTTSTTSYRDYTEVDRKRVEVEERWEMVLNDRLETSGAPREMFSERVSMMRAEAMTFGASEQAITTLDVQLLQEQQQKMTDLMNEMLDSLVKQSDQEISFSTNLVRIDLTKLEVANFEVPTSLPELRIPELMYTRTETAVHTHYEKEETGFSADGVVKTADGREIDFSLDLAMGREFFEETRFTTEESERVKLIDPLVVNFSGTATELSDVKFSFDLNVDGEEEEIFGLLPGSGFLAFDRNENGLIDDGSELFGAVTGNGFDELAEYDLDNNSWIDENDPVFGRLSIWRGGEEGGGILESLEEAGVGAIHLENRDTLFDITDEENNLQARVEKTGVFLKEEGGAGTVQQVKFAV